MPTFGIISGMWRFDSGEKHVVRIIGAAEFLDLLAEIGGGRLPPCIPFFDISFERATNEELACIKKLDMETNKHLMVEWIKEWMWNTPGIRKEAFELVLFNEEE